jgi:hypothetical protein
MRYLIQFHAKREKVDELVFSLVHHTASETNTLRECQWELLIVDESLKAKRSII